MRTFNLVVLATLSLLELSATPDQGIRKYEILFGYNEVSYYSIQTIHYPTGQYYKMVDSSFVTERNLVTGELTEKILIRSATHNDTTANQDWHTKEYLNSEFQFHKYLATKQITYLYPEIYSNNTYRPVRLHMDLEGLKVQHRENKAIIENIDFVETFAPGITETLNTQEELRIKYPGQKINFVKVVDFVGDGKYLFVMLGYGDDPEYNQSVCVISMDKFEKVRKELKKSDTMKCIIFGGSGEVGSAVTRELMNSDVCSELTMIGRRVVDSFQDATKINQVVIDTNSPDLEGNVQEIAQGHEVAISCLGIGSGTRSMTLEQLLEVEVNLFGKLTRGCKAAGIEIFELLMAVGIKERYANSKIKEFRVMGQKYKTALDVNFEKMAVFKPGMIVGNAHTPRWLPFFTQIIPDSFGWGNIHQNELARAFVAHLEKRVTLQTDPVVSYGNKEMKLLIKE